MTGQVQGKVALVTGGASGIGEAVSELLAREGASVAVTDVDDLRGPEVVARIKAQLRRDSGGYVLAFTARSGRSYSVQARDRFGSDEWLPVAEYPTGVEREMVLPVQPANSARFYRILTR